MKLAGSNRVRRSPRQRLKSTKLGERRLTQRHPAGLLGFVENKAIVRPCPKRKNAKHPQHYFFATVQRSIRQGGTWEYSGLDAVRQAMYLRKEGRELTHWVNLVHRRCNCTGKKPR